MTTRAMVRVTKEISGSGFQDVAMYCAYTRRFTQIDLVMPQIRVTVCLKVLRTGLDKRPILRPRVRKWVRFVTTIFVGVNQGTNKTVL